MADPVRKPIPPDRAAASRRAAALYMHWSRKSVTGADGEVAILSEITSKDDWVNLVCALLNLTDGLVRAAREGREEWYVAYVLREAMLDEVTDA